MSLFNLSRGIAINASLGEHDVTAEEGTEQHIPVAEVIRHSPYRSPLHSLAMVRLAQPARLTQQVQPIGLPGRCPRPGDSCSVSGWGSTVPNQCKRTLELLVFLPRGSGLPRARIANVSAHLRGLVM